LADNDLRYEKIKLLSLFVQFLLECKFSVLTSQLLEWFHCIGMNYCHCLSNCNCFAFNITNAIVGWVHYV